MNGLYAGPQTFKELSQPSMQRGNSLTRREGTDTLPSFAETSIKEEYSQ